MGSLPTSNLLPSDDIYDIFLHQLDTRTLHLANLSGQYPEICNNEDFWRQRIELQYGVARLIPGKSFKDAWIACNKIVVYVFDYDYICQKNIDEIYGARLLDTTILMEKEDIYEHYQESFYNKLKKSIDDIVSKIGVELCKYSIDIPNKKIYVTLTNTARWTSKDIADRLQYGIERITKEYNKPGEGEIFHDYLLKVNGYSRIDM